jgi:hypothetical protein
MKKKVISLGDVMMRLSTPAHARFVQTENLKFAMPVRKRM